MPTPEALAREQIDRALADAGWIVQDLSELNIRAGQGIAVREYPLAAGHGFADYLLYVDQQAVGVVEAKAAGATLRGVELQSEKYSSGLPDGIPAPVRPLPFLYESTGIETQFTNRLDPTPKSRELFTFHRAETLAEWLNAEPLWLAVLDGAPQPASQRPATFRTRLTAMPAVEERGLWPAQVKAVRNLEISFAHDRPRALVQMTMGAGKTYTAVSSIYRLIKFAGAKRVLFLVDRANLGRQALKEFQSYRTPDDGRLFTELYNVQLLTSNKLDRVSNVVIGTIQRLYSMLKGDPELPAELDEESSDTAAKVAAGLDALRKEPLPVTYSAALPIETFHVVFIDEAHRSIYTLWRQVVEYWDAFLIGLTATPAKQTYGFFNGNLVMEYGHEQAVADGVNVDFDVYRVRTRISEQGSTVEAKQMLQFRERETRKKRWEKLDDDLTYDASALDRDVVAPDQIRTIVRAFRDRFLPEIFPDRTHVPKALVFAKDDSHADDLVRILRDELSLGNDGVQKITYRTHKPEYALQSFRNSYNPRIAVTVDMIATGTDVKPLEVLWFFRAVKSRTLFEQMKGRGVRVIKPDDLKAVTPDAVAKTRFVILDCVGVSEEAMSDSAPLERKPTITLDILLRQVAMGNVDPEVASTVAGRLARLDQRLGKDERASIAQAAGGRTLHDIARTIVEALDTDRRRDVARAEHKLHGAVEPTAAQLTAASSMLIGRALEPLASSPALRQRILDVQRSAEQVIDEVSQDTLLTSEISKEARERAAALTTSFEQFIAAHRDEYAALTLLYGARSGQRLTREALEELSAQLATARPPLAPEAVWNAYETLDNTRVRGRPTRLLTDIVALVRFALHRDLDLAPWPEVARRRFDAWLAQSASLGKHFTSEQLQWLESIRDHIAANAEMRMDDFELAPFAQRGGLGGAQRAFSDQLVSLVEELRSVVAA